MDGSRQDVKKVFEAMSKSLGGEIPKGVEQMAEKVLKKGATPAAAMGLNDQMIEGVYGQAYRLYNTGKYRDASQLFRLLVMLKPSEQKYVLGLAACFHMSKEYRNAAELYTVCSMIDPETPIPHYHASDCYLQIGDKPSALISLEMAVKRSGAKPEYQQLKDRAALTIQSLQEELQKPKEL